MQHRPQAGFGKTTVLWVLAAVFALGIVFFTFASIRDEDPAATTTSSKSGGQKGYITFPRWKVRAPYNGNLTLSQTTEGDRAVFSSSQLTALDSTCAGQGGTITRYQADDDITPSGTGGVYARRLPKGQGSFGFTTTYGRPDIDPYNDAHSYSYVDGYYYIYTADEGSCAADGMQTLGLHQATAAAVKALASQIEPAR